MTCLAAIAELAMQRRLAGVNRGGRPRLPAWCFPGNQSGSASTSVKNLWRAAFPGQPPPTFSTRSAIHCSWVRPPWISRLASRSARALACCHGDRRPGGADSHKTLRESELGIAEAKDSTAKTTTNTWIHYPQRNPIGILANKPSPQTANAAHPFRSTY